MRLGVASQTPLVRMKRSLADLVAEGGDLGDPVPLARLERGTDYSVTPGGVARMIGSLVENVKVTGEWCALANGFPRDLQLGDVRLISAWLAEPDRQAYGRVKEVVWEALNGLPPKVAQPSRDPDLLEQWALWSRASAGRILERHAEDPFDVLYVNDWQHLPQGPMLGRVPRVMHFHAPFAAWTPPGWRELVARQLAAFDAVVVSTAEWKRALEATGAVRSVHHVYPWIDPALYPPPAASEMAEAEARCGLRPEDRIVLHVGRMDPIKGQDTLTEAFARLARGHPDVRLVLVGNGSFSSSKRAGIGLSKGARWRAHLEEKVAALGLEGRVVFTGHQPHSVVIPLLHRCEVFVFPSVGEGFGLAVAEAWLARKPVVVSRTAGVAEVVRDGENGRTVPPRDPGALAAALEELLTHREAALRMGERGRETALEVCDVRRRAPEVLEVLAAASEGRRPQPPAAAHGRA